MELPQVAERTISIELPVAGDKISWFSNRYLTKAEDIQDYIKGGTSVTYSIKYGDNETDPGTDLITDREATTTERDRTIDLATQGIPARQMVWIEISAVVGSVEKVTIIFGYK